jgi:hypothetical protein
MNLSVSEVVHSAGNRFGHSFSVANEHRAPLITLTFKTAGEAELGRSMVAALLEHAVDVMVHPVRS